MYSYRLFKQRLIYVVRNTDLTLGTDSEFRTLCFSCIVLYALAYVSVKFE